MRFRRERETSTTSPISSSTIRSRTQLAHTFFSVAVRYYTRHIMAPGAKPNLATSILQTLAGEKPAPTRSQILKSAIKGKLRKLLPRKKQSEGTGIIKHLFLDSARRHMDEHRELFNAIENGLPPLGEHAQMFDFVTKIN